MRLMDGKVDVRRRLAVQTEVFDVSDHAHDLDRSRALIVVINAQARAERAPLWPVPAGEVLADERHGRGFGRLAPREFTPPDQWDLQSAKIARGDHAINPSMRFIPPCRPPLHR